MRFIGVGIWPSLDDDLMREPGTRYQFPRWIPRRFPSLAAAPCCRSAGTHSLPLVVNSFPLESGPVTSFFTASCMYLYRHAKVSPPHTFIAPPEYGIHPPARALFDRATVAYYSSTLGVTPLWKSRFLPAKGIAILPHLVRENDARRGSLVPEGHHQLPQDGDGEVQAGV